MVWEAYRRGSPRVVTGHSGLCSANYRRSEFSRGFLCLRLFPRFSLLVESKTAIECVSGGGRESKPAPCGVASCTVCEPWLVPDGDVIVAGPGEGGGRNDTKRISNVSCGFSEYRILDGNGKCTLPVS